MMSSLFYLIVIIMGCIEMNFSMENYYCDRSLCTVAGRRHIACNFRSKFGTKCPSDAKQIQMSPLMIEMIVRMHNEKRNYIAGGYNSKFKPACRMATMHWDYELAYLASLAAAKCERPHERKYCMNTRKYTYPGQAELEMSGEYAYPPEKTINYALEKYFSKIDVANMTHIIKYTNESAEVGLFTLMVTERNIAVGCGLTQFSCKKAQVCQMFVCNYAATNMLNHTVYESCDASAIGCIRGFNPSYPNLCYPSEEYVVNLWGKRS